MRAKSVGGLVFILAHLCGCAAPATLSGPGGDVIKLFTGEVVPASSVVANHPALEHAMPSHPALWAAGLKVPEIHCHFVGPTGKLDRVTLSGVMDAADLGIVSGLFGGEIPPDDIKSASRNLERQASVYAEYVWRKSGGDRGRIRDRIKASVDQDALCLAKRLKVVLTDLELANKGLYSSRDEMGRPLILRQAPQRTREHVQKLHLYLEMHAFYVANVLKIYQEMEAKLNRRLVAVATHPVKRPKETLPKAPVPEGGMSAAPGETPKATALNIDLSAIKRVRDDTAGAIAALKERCLLKAAIECG